MGLDPFDIEKAAVELYRRHGFDPASPVDVFRLVRAHLGPNALVRGTETAGLPAKRYVVRGEDRIALARKLTVPESRFFAGHELAHVVFDELGYTGDDIERACDAFAAAIMAPSPAIVAMVRAFGRDHETIADEVGATQTWAALRIAECFGIPRAVITPAKVHVRGPLDFVWGSESELRRLARTRTTRPGLTKARLTDDPARVVLDVDTSTSDTG